jgi:hypothetical protein
MDATNVSSKVRGNITSKELQPIRVVSAGIYE